VRANEAHRGGDIDVVGGQHIRGSPRGYAQGRNQVRSGPTFLPAIIRSSRRAAS
jgi:hypothetical protein